MVRSYLETFVAGVALSLVLTHYVRNLAVARGWADVPDGDRHFHVNPVPRIGGVAIWLAFVGAVGIALLAPKLVGNLSLLPLRTVLGILGAAMIVFLLGLYDDLRSLGALGKFTVQAFAATLLYLNGVGIHQLDLVSHGHALRVPIGLPLTILWVLLITNAFNLIDGLDGLAAGAALFSTVIIFVISLLRQTPLVSLLTIALAGAIVGFLRYNFNPATIFLGDSGSLFIGFLLSALALVGSQKATTMVAVAIPVVSFGLPILDVALSVARRFLGGKPLFTGDDDHIHHKLIKRGFSQREAVLILYAVSAGFGLLSLALLHGEAMITLVLIVIGLGVWFGVQQLRYPEFAELYALAQRSIQRRRIIANNVQVRQASIALKSCADFETICRVLKAALAPLGFVGYHFQNSRPISLPAYMHGVLQHDAHGGWRCCWAEMDFAEPSWELKLALNSPTGHRWAHFSLFRSADAEPLLVDFNLLDAEFRAAISEALHRALSHLDHSDAEEGPSDAHPASKALSATASR